MQIADSRMQNADIRYQIVADAEDQSCNVTEHSILIIITFFV